MDDIARTLRFHQQLRRALSLPPPTAAKLASYTPELSYGRHQGPAHDDVRPGAVLVLLYPDAADWNLVLTVRTSHLSSHAGQVSFPGGRLDPGESPEQAALREYEEELGRLKGCEVIGRLSDAHVFASNFLVTPVVGMTTEKPWHVPNPHEVAEVIELPLTWLADRTRRGHHQVVRGPLRFDTPHLRVGGRHVWGATWMMLGELLERLESAIN